MVIKIKTFKAVGGLLLCALSCEPSVGETLSLVHG